MVQAVATSVRARRTAPQRVNLEAVATVRGHEAARQPLPAPRDITARAVAGDDALCSEVVDILCGLLGVYAGNVALTFGAAVPHTWRVDGAARILWILAPGLPDPRKEVA